MSNRYVYHYCLSFQESNRSMSYIDGIALMENKITNMDDYRDLKVLAAPRDKKGEVTINSLSFIGMEQG